MALTAADLSKYIYDPSLMQKVQLDMLANSLSGLATITDPTSPFVMCLEVANTTASAAIIETNNIIRKKYPSLANLKDDLYHHLNDNQLSFIYATPAEVTIDFFVSIVDILNSGYRPEGANYMECIIPKYTKVTILDIPLLLLNNINIKLYDNSSIYVEQELNTSNALAYDNVGAIPAEIYNTPEDTPWIHFKVKMKQLDRIHATKPILASDGFQHVITIEDKYCYGEISYTTVGSTIPLALSYNDEYIDPLKPTAFVSTYNKNIYIRIPDVYLLEGSVSGVCNMSVYTTRGKLYVPIDNYMADDYTITLGETGTTPASAAIKNIGILVNSADIINGGVDNISEVALRDTIINNINNISLPITQDQLKFKSNLKGYIIINVEDTATNRLFLALRSLPDIEGGLIQAKQEVYFNTCKMILEEVKDSNYIVNKGDFFVIKSNSIFKLNNGLVEIIKKEEQDYLNSLSKVQLIAHLETNKYFYNPYYYIIETTDTYTNSRVYDLDICTVDNMKIVNKNLNVAHRVNISQYDLAKLHNGYRLIVTLAPNEEFKTLNSDSIFLQLKLPLFNGSNHAYINSVYDKENDYHYFMLETDFIVDEENMLILNNGVSNLYTKKFQLNTSLEIYTMSYDPSCVDTTKFLQTEVNVTNVDSFTIFTKEDFKITFGKHLDKVYNRIYNVFTEKKYKRHTHDLPLVYEEDVYKVDGEFNTPFLCNENEYDHEIEFELLHSKGDPVLDDEGQPSYKYRKGDMVLDNDGNPIIDYSAGVERYIDLLLFEYEFMVADSLAYVNYRRNNITVINKFILDDLADLNGDLLENTEILYKSYKSSKDIQVIVNNTYEYIPYVITPIITLYMKNTSNVDTNTQEDYKTTIGNIINRHFDLDTLILEDIKKEIITELGSSIVAGVKIEGIGDGSEIIKIKNENTKLTLNKLLSLNINNEFIVKYNIKLNIRYI